MTRLNRQALLSLEAYSEQRTGFRNRVMAEKKNRSVTIGEHVLLLFENRLTIQYQIQEMLRIEKIFDASGIEEELQAYNPLIPDGDNWKATMMIQFDEVEERRRKLAELVGIETQVWVQVGDSDRIYAVADEDMDRADEHKTSAVHFLRWPLSTDFITRVKNGEAISIGVSHPAFQASVSPLPEAGRRALQSDLV